MNQNIPLDLGTEKISKLLRKYAVPAIIAMTASSLYNIVDSIFIGQGVGPYAISGLALTFPIMNLAAAFGTLVGVGASTLTSMLLGQRNYGTAKLVLGNVFVLNIIMGLFFTVVSLVFLEPVLYFFGASENTISYARDYLVIILSGNIITHMYFGLNALLRSSGHPKQSMYATILAVFMNCLFDYLFIFVFKWGIRGAAAATILAQAISLTWELAIFSRKSELIHFQRGIFKLKKKIVKDSFAIGLAPFLMNSVSCMVVIVINKQLGRYGGDMAIGAYGIVNRVAFLFIMIVMGFTQGMQPIAGYNYGARQNDRVIKILHLTIISAVSVMTLGFLSGMFFPESIVSLFTQDPELIEKSAIGLRVCLFVFPFVGFQMVVGNFFQCIGKPGRSILLSLSRQLIFLLPSLFLLPLAYDIKGVWLSFPVSDAASVIMALILYITFMKRFKSTTISERA